MKNIHDAEQRKEALNPYQSYIVQAPAGSGKTELLMQRFLVLLSHAKQPEEILAITFTKKSAAEMRIRIIQALTNALTGTKPLDEHHQCTFELAQRVLEHDKKMKWQLIHNPNRLKIQTMDSFNAYLTRQLPILSRFGGTPDMSDHAYPLYEAAVYELFNSLKDNPEWADDTKELLLHLDNDLNSVQNLLITMLAKRDQWLPYVALDIHNQNLRHELESYLEIITVDVLLRLSSDFPKEEMSELITLANVCSQNLLRDNVSSPITLCHNLTSLPGTTVHDKKIWLALTELLLTKEGHWRKRFDKNIGFPAENSVKNKDEKNLLRQFKARMTQLIERLQANTSIKNVLDELLVLPSTYYEESQWQLLQSLMMVLRVAVAQLKLVFQQQGTIDYIENAESALFALGTDDQPTDITLALDYQIRHILIDEFQDTSTSQYRLIEKLIMGWHSNDGRTLFVVGDPMQSIYRFREAEVGLFIRARQQGIGSVLLVPLTLSVNFRSDAGIVQWVNKHFKEVFPSYDDMSMGAVSYSQSHAFHLNDLPCVTLYNDFLQADRIANIICSRKLLYPEESIAILVRSRTHLSQIIPALRKSNIAYKAIEIDPLSQRPMIQDLLVLTKVLYNPSDRVALLSFLRAPWSGLSLADLLLLTGSKPLKSLMDRINDPSVLKLVSEDGQKRLLRIMPILQAKLAERNRYTLRLWVESTWLLLGGPATLTTESDLADADAFFNLLDKIDQNGDLPSITHLEDSIQRLYASPNTEDERAVQIMTIHNAKGLEFDTVILPHLEKKSAEDSKQLLLWMEKTSTLHSNAFILSPIPSIGTQDNPSIYSYVKLKQKEKNDFEMTRLLYVAATRAKKQLHLLFSIDGSSSDDIQPDRNSLLAKLWPSIKNQVSIYQNKANIQQDIVTNSTRAIHRLTLDWINPIKEAPSTPIAYHQSKSSFTIPDFFAAHVGTAVHALLQKIGQYGASWWLNRSSSVKKSFLYRFLQELNLVEEEIPKAINLILTAIQNTLEDPRGKWILNSHKDAAVEFKITALINDKIHSLVVDRTFIENNIRWIIDYKTAYYPGNDVESFLNNEQKKYEEQLRTYALAFRNIENRIIRIGLYFPLMKAWREIVDAVHETITE